MNWLGIEYRDPLFGIIVLFIFIFAISFIAYSMKIRKETKAKEAHQDLLKRFELGDLEVNDYINLFTTNQLPLQSIMLLSTTFLQKGDYNKAITLYLALLEHTKERSTKEEILEALGKTYYKTGLLQRSKDIFLQILKYSPRSKNSLLYLLLTYEKLKDYKGALEVLEPLIELGNDCSKEKIYLLSEVCLNNSTLSHDKKLEQIEAIYEKNHFIERLFLTFLIRFQPSYFWSNINIFNLMKIVDILWYLPKSDINFEQVEKNQFLSELYSAKGLIKTKITSNIFEIDILLLNKQRENNNINLDLNFEYICSNCKNTHYVYSNRCNSCNHVLSLNPIIKLTKLNFEKNNSLQ